MSDLVHIAPLITAEMERLTAVGLLLTWWRQMPLDDRCQFLSALLTPEERQTLTRTIITRETDHA